jgi:hypothetical protein
MWDNCKTVTDFHPRRGERKEVEMQWGKYLTYVRHYVTHASYSNSNTISTFIRIISRYSTDKKTKTKETLLLLIFA